MENHQKRTTYDKILEIAAIVALLGACYPLLFYGTIDSNTLIPIHYNFAGEVDRWGDRSVLWIFPPIALLFYIGLSMLQKYPHTYNYPSKVTKENADYLYKMGVQLMRHIKVLTIFILAYLNNNTYTVAIGRGTGPNEYILYALIAGILLLVIIYSIKMVLYKPKI